MRRPAHIALPLLVFAFGLGVGAWFSSSRRTADFSTGTGPRLAENADAAAASAAKNTPAFSSQEEMLTALMSAVAEEEPLLRAHRLRGLLGRLDSAELAQLFDRVVRVDDRDRRGVVLDALLTRWFTLDPAAATAAVRPYRDRFRALVGNDWRSLEAAVNDAWAQAQPETVLAEALAAPNARWAQVAAGTALRALAEGDPARQLDLLAHLPANRLRAELCESVIQEIAAKDSAAAEAALSILPEPRQRARMQAEILGQLAERDPAAGLARLAALAPDLTPGTTSTLLLSKVLGAAAKKDAAAALAVADGLPEELRTPALGAVLVGWAGEHPAEALAWAVANSVDISGAKVITYYDDRGGFSTNSLISTAFGSDREKTLAWLRTQDATPRRDALLRYGIWNGSEEQKMAVFAELTPESRAGATGSLVQSLYRDSPERATAWVQAQPAGAVRAAAVQNLTYHQAENAPERLDTLAETWPAGSDRDAALRAIAGTLSQNDPLRALEFARRIGGSVARETAYENVAESWSYRDKPAARAWLATAPELSAEQKRVLLRQFDER